MVDENELQEKVLAYRIFEARMNSLLKQREAVAAKIVELETTVNSINEIEKNKEDVIFPIGSEAYTFVKIGNEDKIIVEIGAGVALEKTFAEARIVLKERREDVERALENVQKELEQTSAALEHLTPGIQKLIDEQEKKEAG